MTKLTAAVVLVVITLLTRPAGAITVNFAVDPALIGVVGSSDVDLFSPNLNGIVLQGQTLSLDLVLTDAVLARHFLLTPDQLGVLLNVHTNASTFPGNAGPTTGFLLHPDGTPLHAPIIAGRAQGDDGTFSMGLVSFTPALLGGANVVDISGVHFDTTFPDTGFVVTDAQLRFSIHSGNRIEFGTAEQLPEHASLVLLLIGTLGALLLHRQLREPQRSIANTAR
jgi:hypothetical protein